MCLVGVYTLSSCNSVQALIIHENLLFVIKLVDAGRQETAVVVCLDDRLKTPVQKLIEYPYLQDPVEKSLHMVFYYGLMIHKWSSLVDILFVVVKCEKATSQSIHWLAVTFFDCNILLDRCNRIR
jgi:hypothetical protein